MGKEITNYDDSKSLRIRKTENKNIFRHRVNFNKEIISSLLNIKDKKKNWKDLKILDVGCGYGDFPQYLHEQDSSWKIWGIDISKGMIDEAKKSTDQSIKYAVADTQKLPFKDRSFDVLVAKHMVYHIDDIRKGLNEMHRVLKDDGILIITLNSLANGSRANIERYLKEMEKVLNAKRIQTITKANMENFFQYVDKSQFKILEIRTYFNYGEIENSGLLKSYLESYRDFFSPKPTPEKWGKALFEIDKRIAAEIKKRGKIDEVRGLGIIKLQKIIN